MAAAANGANGIMVECHPHPEQALCDGAQSITPPQLVELVKSAHNVFAAVREVYEPEEAEAAA
jgi:3-deoxy-D-arabino-heptulosonate 7-phosphate (DAHP) synthase